MEKLSDNPGIPWRPYTDELEVPYEQNPVLRKFMSWLKNCSPTGFSETCKDLAAVALSALLVSFIKRKCIAIQVKLSMMIHGLT